jgi:hypothetical protein
MSFDAVRPGHESTARDSLGVCICCDERIREGEPVRWEVRLVKPPLGRGRTISLARHPRWVHAECYQDGPAREVLKRPRP